GRALSADRLKIGGGIYLHNGFTAEGEVRLLGATVGGNLECDNGQFINKGGIALNADGVKVGGYIFLLRFKAEGGVWLLNATVGRNLECQMGQFINKGGKALNADGLEVAGGVFLHEDFNAEGEVRLLGATVGGNLICEGGQFINNDGRAINADGVKVVGNVFLRNRFRAHGTVSLVGATIDKYLSLTGVESPEHMMLDLNSAKIGTLHDKEDSWPVPKHLVLHGLEYKDISHKSPRDAETRIEWLRRQKGFSPQPYEQLAKVLRESGDDSGAKDVLIAKNKDKAYRTELTRAQWLWYRLFGPLVGYGHKPWLAAPLALMIVLSGWVFFKEGHSHGLVTPLTESAYSNNNAGIKDPGGASKRISEVYPVFNPLVYSIDVFVPVVDLRQARYWLPNANRGSELVPTSSAALCTGGLLLFWLWFEIACGWILTTLFLVGLTGLVRT
ncbi:MAG: hypothetical protein GQ528_06140, partial [Woeseiaceae bacterium]|nr:hypothetical protein [Woeseiaceae bacterium]